MLRSSRGLAEVLRRFKPASSLLVLLNVRDGTPPSQIPNRSLHQMVLESLRTVLSRLCFHCPDWDPDPLELLQRAHDQRNSDWTQ